MTEKYTGMRSGVCLKFYVGFLITWLVSFPRGVVMYRSVYHTRLPHFSNSNRALYYARSAAGAANLKSHLSHRFLRQLLSLRMNKSPNFPGDTLYMNVSRTRGASDIGNNDIFNSNNAVNCCRQGGAAPHDIKQSLLSTTALIPTNSITQQKFVRKVCLNQLNQAVAKCFKVAKARESKLSGTSKIAKQVPP